MWKKQVRERNNQVREMTSAACVQDYCQSMVRQMVLPLLSERRTKGALDFVSRESGISFSKVKKIYYGLTDHILAYERDRLKAARDRLLIRQQQTLEQQLSEIRRLRTERELVERQSDLAL